jgi:hydroxymethylpyrimidine pyrophosphatase-like HAD family hydrolase
MAANPAAGGALDATVAVVLRALYVDLDGTLLGPGGSLFSAPGGGFSMEGARALQACARADVEVVIFTGRKQPGVYDTMRLIGQRSYIFELGCGLVLDGELEWLTGDCVPSAERGTIFEQITASGAPRLLLDTFAGRLEYHRPWSDGREVSHLFRGLVPADEAAALLHDAGLDWLRLVDNGVVHAGGLGDVPSGWSIDLERVHVYHLIPACASKATAVARHMQNRGYAPEECIACGDSREDLEAASVLGTFWMMANGPERDPTIAAELSAWPNARVTTAGFGAGVYEAVVTTLAET